MRRGDRDETAAGPDTRSRHRRGVRSRPGGARGRHVRRPIRASVRSPAGSFAPPRVTDPCCVAGLPDRRTLHRNRIGAESLRGGRARLRTASRVREAGCRNCCAGQRSPAPSSRPAATPVRPRSFGRRWPRQSRARRESSGRRGRAPPRLAGNLRPRSCGLPGSPWPLAQRRRTQTPCSCVPGDAQDGPAAARRAMDVVEYPSSRGTTTTRPSERRTTSAPTIASRA